MSAQQQWEYTTDWFDLEEDPQKMQSSLSRTGSEGWELVTATPYKTEAGQRMLVAIFKRPLQAEGGGLQY